MKKATISMLVAGMMCFGTAAYAQDTTTGVTKDQIKANYKADKAKCDAMSGNDKDVCVADAKGTRSKAEAQMDSDKKPSAKATKNLKYATAEADYNSAKARCEGKTGNDKDVCIQAAKTAETSAKADAKAGQKTANARADATDDKMSADYKLATDKCDGMTAGAAKDKCYADAKAMYKKS